MNLFLLDSQHVFSHKPSFLPRVRLLTYLRRRDGKKKAGLKSRLKSYKKPVLTVYIFSDTTYNCRIHYYQWSHDFSPILKSRIFLLNCASLLLTFPCVLILLISISVPDDGSVLLPKHVIFYWFYLYHFNKTCVKLLRWWYLIQKFNTFW
jgi:hypothetical protein